MTDTASITTADTANFWLQLEAVLDLAAASAAYETLVIEMINEYCARMPVLDADAALDAGRQTLLRRALAICARH